VGDPARIQSRQGGTGFKDSGGKGNDEKLTVGKGPISALVRHRRVERMRKSLIKILDKNTRTLESSNPGTLSPVQLEEEH